MAAAIPASATSKALCPRFSSTTVFKSLADERQEPSAHDPEEDYHDDAPGPSSSPTRPSQTVATFSLSVPQIYLGRKPLGGRVLGTWVNGNDQAYTYLGYLAFDWWQE